MSARSRLAWPLVLCAVGAVTLALGLALAYGTRDQSSPIAAVVTLAVGNALVLAGTAWIVRRELAADGLVVEGEERLPTPAWWYPVALIGVVDIAAGPAASGWLGLVGVLLVAAAAGAAGRALLRTSLPDRGHVRAARRLRTVAGPGGGPLVGAIEPVGRSGVRVVAVGPDGAWLDVMLRDSDAAQSVVALAGLELLDQTDPAFSRAFGSSATRPRKDQASP